LKHKYTKEERKVRLDKALRIVKITFQSIALVASLAFVGIIIAMIVIYGLDATANELFLASDGTTLGLIGIPFFSVVLLSAIVIAILNLRDDLLVDEKQASEFKMIEQVAEVKE